MNISDASILSAAGALIAALTERQLLLGTAESCTGGGVGAALTAVPGASAVYCGGVIAYSNAVKQALLDVSESVLAVHGAVSVECARAMLAGAMKALGADAAIATTGIAGPGGGTPEKPVGTVVIGARLKTAEKIQVFHFSGDRDAVREQSIGAALLLLTNLLNNRN